jgi:hypothetical protein
MTKYDLLFNIFVGGFISLVFLGAFLKPENQTPAWFFAFYVPILLTFCWLDWQFK